MSVCTHSLRMQQDALRLSPCYTLEPTRPLSCPPGALSSDRNRYQRSHHAEVQLQLRSVRAMVGWGVVKPKLVRADLAWETQDGVPAEEAALVSAKWCPRGHRRRSGNYSSRGERYEQKAPRELGGLEGGNTTDMRTDRGQGNGNRNLGHVWSERWLERRGGKITGLLPAIVTILCITTLKPSAQVH